jgi:hypothetical protein
MGFAADCMDSGCATEDVTNLVEHLKAVKDPSAEVVEAIKDLEALVSAEEPNKNALGDLIEGLFGTFKAVDARGTPTKETLSFAKSCLEEGCPIDTTAELVAQLKVAVNPSPDVLKTIEMLEEVLASDKPNKNLLNLVIGDLVKAAALVADNSDPSLGYSAK